MKILGFQLTAEEIIEKSKEYVIEESVKNQILNSFDLIDKYNPDIVIYPEMCYLPCLEEHYKKLSENKIIISGSYYNKKNINTTIVFDNCHKKSIPKIYPSPFEPMFITNNIDEEPLNIIKNWENEMNNDKLPEYFIRTKSGKIIVILNCLDYYKLGYYVARSNVLSKDLIALISPCSNNKMQVFIEETQAIHNHNENLYSIVINSLATLDGEKYSIGNSYIFGMIDNYSHINQLKNGNNINHNASIVNIKNGSYAIFIDTVENFSSFKRSDYYKRNPKEIDVIPLIK